MPELCGVETYRRILIGKRRVLPYGLKFRSVVERMDSRVARMEEKGD